MFSDILCVLSNEKSILISCSETNQRMYLVGLTGGIATGKSTVCRMMNDLNIPIIDSDIVAREVVEPGTPAFEKIISTFGTTVLTQDGSLDRAKLGSIVFHDVQQRQKLNKITHPEIFKVILWKLLKYLVIGTQFVIIDTPLFFETNLWKKYVEKVIVVYCTEEQEIERFMARNKISKEEAITRINTQMSLSKKCSLADIVIDNSRTLEETNCQVQKICMDLKKSKAQWKLRIILLSLTFFTVVGIYQLLSYLRD